MANVKLTDKASAGSNTASGDLFMIVDVSDTTGSASGTSKKIKAERVIQTTRHSLNNATIIALDDGGAVGEYYELVSAPGSGKAVIPLTVSMICTGAGTTETANKDLYIGFNETSNTVYWQYWSRFNGSLASGSIRTYINNGEDTRASGSYDNTIDNKPLRMWSNGTFNGGWSMDVYITYQIIDL